MFDLHAARARRRARQDDVAGKQGHDLGQVGHQPARLEDQILRIRLLYKLAVDAALDRKVVRIDLRLDVWAQRHEGVEALRECPLALLGLEVAGRHVVGAAVAQDVGVGLSLVHFVALLAYDDGKLRLLVELAAH